jgi:hypothetical protein
VRVFFWFSSDMKFSARSIFGHVAAIHDCTGGISSSISYSGIGVRIGLQKSERANIGCLVNTFSPDTSSRQSCVGGLSAVDAAERKEVAVGYELGGCDVNGPRRSRSRSVARCNASSDCIKAEHSLCVFGGARAFGASNLEVYGGNFCPLILQLSL